MQGKKFDNGKNPLHLLPTEALKEVGKVLAFGAEKYDDWNWKSGMKWSRLSGAALRHLFAWIEREDKDQETGLSHLAHAGCCVLFLLTYEILGLGEDDRWKPADPWRTDEPIKKCGVEIEGEWGPGSNFHGEIVTAHYCKDWRPKGQTTGSSVCGVWGNDKGFTVHDPVRWRFVRP